MKRRGTAPSAWFSRIRLRDGFGRETGSTANPQKMFSRAPLFRFLPKISTAKFQFLIQLLQLLIEVGERRFQSFFVVGVGRRFQIVQDMFAREFDVRAFPVLL